MNLVYTWSKNKHRRWLNLDYEILTLLTSIKYSLKYYKNIILYTNKESFQLIEQYKLPIKIIILDEEDSDLWIINKINTYLKQTKSFIHIDADLILLKDFDKEFKNSRIGFQSIDNLEKYQNNFYNDRINNLINEGINIKKNIQESYSFGVYVCNDLEVNKEYCNEVLKLCKNVKALNLKTILPYNIVLEQYIMASMLLDRKITPFFIKKEYDENIFLEKGIIHLMHNKNNLKYYTKIKELYEQF